MGFVSSGLDSERLGSKPFERILRALASTKVLARVAATLPSSMFSRCTEKDSCKQRLLLLAIVLRDPD